MELNYVVQNYAWGKTGHNSKVAYLYLNVNKNIVIDPSLPFAELWLGIHENGPSRLKHSGELLSNILEQHPEYLGSQVLAKFGGQLPFLLKVLSVNTALSIQAHPTKKLAERLHNLFPDIYKDPNHKPEMAIALTPFEALCGFRPYEEILYFLENIPELNPIVGECLINSYKNDTEKLRSVFTILFLTPKELIHEQLKKLLQRLKNSDDETRTAQMANLVERLHSDYPGDVGCFVIYFLNFVTLKPFEAMFLPANMPHAYISGDCVECMASSDNVVRAGLTPKYIDVDTLCDILDYNSITPQQVIFSFHQENEFTKVYKPPVADFAVAEIKITGRKEYELMPRSTVSIILIISGEGRSDETLLIPGSALFLPCQQTFNITEISGELLIYQAFVNV